MKIVHCHNFYQQAGGEDQVFDDETRLLESHGHEVIRFVRHNDAIKQMTPLAAAVGTIWNRQASAELRQVIRRTQPALVHFTNTFPLISPAAYYAARKEGVKVVQSLHNYRLICPNALLLRNGKPCEDCLGKAVPWPAVRHACYRNDRRATTVLAAMLGFHRALGTWNRMVDLFIALTEFSRDKFIQGGLPAEKIVVKPNFIRVDPGLGDGSGGYAVFVGRLAPEKGIDTLLGAWSKYNLDLPLTILGDGPLAEAVRQAAQANPRIRWLGHQSADRVLEIVGAAKFLLLPSVWYEGLPKIIVEAFSRGTPVIASNLGAMTELIEHGRTGLLFRAGDAAALAGAINNATRDEAVLAEMRLAARQKFEQKFTAEANYQMLMSAYRRALGQQAPDCEPSDDESAPALAPDLVAASFS